MRSPRQEFIDEYLRFSLDEECPALERHLASPHGDDEASRREVLRAPQPQHQCSDLATDPLASESSLEGANSLGSFRAEVTASTLGAPKAKRHRRTLEERREQNRLTVQRFYYRKKTMRAEEARLAQEYEKLRGTIREATRDTQQHSEYTQLVLLKESLQHQNQLLRDMVSTRAHSFDQLHRTFARHSQRLRETAEPATSFEFIPMVSQEECNHLVRVQFTLHDWECHLDPSPPECKDSAQFMFVKRIPANLRPVQVAQQTLEMWTKSSEVHAQLFPNYVHSSARVLQQINESNFIILQKIEKRCETPLDSFEHCCSIPNRAVQRVQTILHVAFIPLESNQGYTVLMRSIAPHHYELESDDKSSEIPTEWMDTFSWCTISEGTNEVTWGGKIRTSGTTPAATFFDMSIFDWVIYEITRTVYWETAISESSVPSV
ncbi:hypothetical protein FI667_g15631, partial [Globisporangium splendens]